MSIAVFVILILSIVVLLMSTIAAFIVNIKMRENMMVGGMKPIVLSYIMSFAIFAMFCLDLILVYRYINGEASIDILTAILILFAASVNLLYLRFRKSLSRAILNARSHGEEVKNIRNVIMANVSHEIRTPMNTIVGLIEILRKDNTISETAKEHLDSMNEASNSLLGVVNNLIDFAKIDSNRLDIIECDYNTKDVIIDIINKTNYQLSDKSVEFLADVDSNLPSVLHGDDVRLAQALFNILSNACKYTHVGVITFRVTSRTTDKEHVMLHFDVEDTGSGISAEDKQYIFTPNNKASFTHSSSRGAGLGLLISKNIIEQMGGTITFSSEEGVGTDFSIEIPQRIIDIRPIGEIKEEAAASNDRYMFTAPMAKVLVVDDNIVNLFVAKEILSNYEMEVQTASSGAECIDLVNENYYDIIFMDYVMPDMDGRETLLKLRQPESEYFRKIPVVALTAQTGSGGEKIYLEEGFQGYLAKPLDVHDLEKVLLKFLPEEYICRKEGYAAPALQSDCNDKLWFKRLSSVLVDFDVKQGLEHCNNDYTSYMNLLRVIYSDSFSQTTKLKTFVETGNYEEYRIMVHAMKSVSASAGDMKLSYICQENENAAKNGDIIYIQNHLSTLISEYESFLSQIDTILQRESEMMNRGLTSHKEDKTDDEIKEITGRLIAALEDYNIDDCESAIAELEHTNLEYSKEKVISDVKDLLMLFKYEEAENLIKENFGE